MISAPSRTASRRMACNTGTSAILRKLCDGFVDCPEERTKPLNLFHRRGEEGGGRKG